MAARSFFDKMPTAWSMLAWAREPRMSCLARRKSNERDSRNWMAKASCPPPPWEMRACQYFCGVSAAGVLDLGAAFFFLGMGASLERIIRGNEGFGFGGASAKKR